MIEAVQQLSETIRKAASERTLLRIRGGGTKDFYGLALIGEVVDPRACSGIVEYEPTELVLTAGAGTPLSQVQSALAERGQMLAFEPPHFGPAATLGGCVASGFSGPRRAYTGSARDFVLGVRMIDGKGDVLRFGGQVMKNVAGYDLSRLMAGSFGTLGVITELSLKVLPLPAEECTVRLEMDEASAIEAVNRWAGRPLPLSATCHVDGNLYVRLSGAASAVAAGRKSIGGEVQEDADRFWQSIREQTHPFFTSAASLWRFSVNSTTPPMNLGPQVLEWNGSLRWVAAALEPAAAHEAAARAGGHATLFRSGDKRHGIQRLTAATVALHRKLKRAFDPEGILGPGRLHADF